MATNLELFAAFARISVSTFGGGYAMLPFFQRELVEKKGWLTDEELLDLNAVAQCTPGVIAVNTSTFCGYRTKGLTGAVFATLGVIFPPVLIVLVISAFFGVTPALLVAGSGLFGLALYQLRKGAGN